MSFFDTINTVDINVPQDRAEGPPRFNWLNGSKSARSGGMFYIKQAELGAEPGGIWMPSERFDNEDGFETNELNIAVIGVRKQAFRVVDGRRIYLPAWEEGASIHTELLCFADGLEEPAVWSAKGLTGKALAGILQKYRSGLLREAERKAGKRLALWTFWLPISSQVDQHGRIAYVSTGYASNVITPPALHLPSDDMAENMETLFVGTEMLQWGSEVRKQYDDWLKAKRGTEPEGSGNDSQKQETVQSFSTPDEPDDFEV